MKVPWILCGALALALALAVGVTVGILIGHDTRSQPVGQFWSRASADQRSFWRERASCTNSYTKTEVYRRRGCRNR